MIWDEWNKEVCKKPPLGIIPEIIWKRKRYLDLHNAIGRYINEGFDPLPEWVEESSRLGTELYGYCEEDSE